jgi:hypothetical protein
MDNRMPWKIIIGLIYPKPFEMLALAGKQFFYGRQ